MIKRFSNKEDFNLVQGDASMLLTKLLDATTETIQIVGIVDKDIRDMFIDSRTVTKMSCYVAIKGYTRDGHDFIDNAIENGATVVFHENELKNLKKHVTYIKVANTELALKQMVPIFYQENQAVEIVGVTGTNGKTTVTTLLDESFTILRKNTGLIGTVK
jgi:UDP-N-acetylmuramoyl-L-alanyl-D-glutamate--2,6-diaminopimelate ligase